VNGLLEFRQNIDEVDQRIVDLLKERFGLTDQVMQYKRKEDLPLRDSIREQQIITTSQIAAPELDPDFISRLYQTIFDYSIRKARTE